MTYLDSIMVESSRGLAFEYNFTTSKLQIFNPAPPIVWDEVLTPTANVASLAFPPAFILSVAGLNSSSIPVTDSAATLANSQCKPSNPFAAGARGALTFASNIVCSVRVAYITQAWKEVWDNLVQEEAFAGTTAGASATGVSLAYQPLAFQNIRAAGTVPTNVSEMLTSSAIIATKGVVIVDTSDKSLIFKAGDAIASGVATYIKMPSSGFLAQRFVAEAAYTVISSPAQMGMASVLITSAPVLFWSTPQVAVLGASSTYMINPTGTLGTSLCKYDLSFGAPRVATNYGSIARGRYVWGTVGELVGIRDLEVRDGVDLSYLTDVRFTVTGS
jgi:hypothetical protein